MGEANNIAYLLINFDNDQTVMARFLKQQVLWTVLGVQ